LANRGLSAVGNELIKASYSGADFVSPVGGKSARNPALLVLSALVPAVGLVGIKQILEPRPLGLCVLLVHSTARGRFGIWFSRHAHGVRSSRAARVRRIWSAYSLANCA
jgi:hypothetical protein